MEVLERAVCPWLVYAVPDTSGSADANGDGGFTAFWNRETLTRKGGVARVWNEWEYSRPQRRPDGKQYIRALYYFAIDCVHQQFRIEAGEYYDSTASHVEDEHDLDNDPDEPPVWHRIDSGTALNGLSTAVCPVRPLSR